MVITAPENLTRRKEPQAPGNNVRKFEEQAKMVAQGDV